MIYYKVKQHHDQKPKGNNDIYIGNELYTFSEIKNNNLDIKLMDLFEISKNKTYFMFGSRRYIK